MEFSVDFLPVEGEGACAVVRYREAGAVRVLVYDGGRAATADLLVRQLQSGPGPARIDALVSSHPGAGHIEGLQVLLERVAVSEVWMHQPWLHEEGRRAGLAEPPPAPIARGRALATAAARRGIPVKEPFEGAAIGPFKVLSPDRRWYFGALARALESPPPPGTAAAAFLRRLLRVCALRLGRGLLLDALPTRPAFEGLGATSVVLHAEFAAASLLLTGNAGNEALHRACDVAHRLGRPLGRRLQLLQLPNQGREDHLSAAVLDRLVGPRGGLGVPASDGRVAFASVARDAPPSSTALMANALARRGMVMRETRGLQWRHGDAGPQPGGPPDPLDGA